MTALSDLAFDYVLHTGKNIFLTGKAGTGKTTLLRKIVQESFKRTVVAAPTGVAAVNAGGVTIHSLMSIHPFTFLPSNSPQFFGEHQRVETAFSLNRNLRLAATKLAMLRSIELLVIDEVSMLRCDLLDAVDLILRKARRNNEPFGGVQLLLIGDLLQLPPIVKPEEEILLRKHYSSFYFFESLALKQAGFQMISLQHVYRQQQPEFLHVLNEVRNGSVSFQTQQILQKRYEATHEQIANDASIIALTTHRYQSENINHEKLAALSHREITLMAIIDGDFNQLSAPVENELKLKVGARVMFLKNDKLQRFYNGKIGTVTEINTDEDYIGVLPDGETEAILVTRETWQNKQYKLNEADNEIKEDIKGMFSQFPLRLAWAVTIHKSQGLTFQKMKIDAAQVFTSGQLYVALSRCTSLEGLFLLTPVAYNHLQPAKEIVDFSNQQPEFSELANMYLHDQWLYVKQVTKQAYQLKSILDEAEMAANALFRKDKSIDISSTIAIKAEIEQVLNQFIPVYEKVLIQIENNVLIEKNIQKLHDAVQWFANKINAELLHAIHQLLEDFNAKEQKEIFKQHLNAFYFDLKEKSRLLVLSSLLLKKYLNADEVSIKETLMKQLETISQKRGSDITIKKAKTKVKGASIDETVALFEKLNSVKLTAKERGLAESTIEGHLALAVEQGKIDAERIVSPKELAKILSAFENQQLDSLKDYYAFFKSKISYGKLRIAQAVLKMEKK